ncbi:MAG: hypothetical protein IJK81_10095 [Selenomonadaceae bacterium]|nr:hypothetical protein [Selenomonadaceae bacterium]
MVAETPKPESKIEDKPTPVEVVNNSSNMERLETFFMFKTLIHDSLHGQALTYKDSKNWLEILLGEKCLCRFSYDEMCLYINLKSSVKDEVKRKIRSVDDVNLSIEMARLQRTFRTLKHFTRRNCRDF